MPLLPLTVESVVNAGGQLYKVTLTMADGTSRHYLVPVSLATVEGVTISALAMATLMEPDVTFVNAHHRYHRRYDPRTG